MKKTPDGRRSTPLLDAIIEGIQNVKGKAIVHLDLRHVPNTPCEHFIICHGDSDTQVEAIAGSIWKTALERAGEKPWHTEGEHLAEWILLDYVDVVVHVFHRDRRAYYAIEDLWADAIRRDLPQVA
jgi:ribosome-associated protein